MIKIQKIYMLIAVFFACLSNIAGAFGTHALKKIVTPQALSIFETGAQYQFYHSLALLILSLLMYHLKNKWILASGASFITGIILFSGSLYALSLTPIKVFFFITPLGGLAFILGWLFMGVAILKQ